jgi:hypothetical protein
MLKRGPELSANLDCSSDWGPPVVDVGEIENDKVEKQVTYLWDSFLVACYQFHEEIVGLKIYWVI